MMHEDVIEFIVDDLRTHLFYIWAYRRIPWDIIIKVFIKAYVEQGQT